MNKSQFSLLIFTNVALIFLIGVGLYFIFQQKIVGNQNPSKDSTSSAALKPAVINPNDPTAKKYFPGGGTVADFRDGAEGDFKAALQKGNNETTLSWDSNNKVYEVRVLDLGKLDNLSDSTIAFDLGVDPYATISDKPTKDTAASPKPPSQPPIPSPYKIGDTPAGFKNLTPALPSGQKADISSIFKKGVRYSIELYGIDSNNGLKTAYYTFTD